MKIAVCIKQVPSTEAKVDWETGTLIRNPAQTGLNRYDAFAIEVAMKIKEALGGEVTAFTMGPSSAEKVLKESFSYGVDRGYLITDRSFAGADVLITSYTLYQAISSTDEFDIIICGQQTSDGDTAQVPPSLASWLNIPFVSWVRKIISMEKQRLVVDITGTERIYQVEIATPCLLSVEENICDVRIPTLQKKIEARKKTIKQITLKDLPDQKPEHYGLKASPTKVVKMYTPKVKQLIEPKEVLSSFALAEILKERANLDGETK